MKGKSMRNLVASLALAGILAVPFAALPSDTYAQRSVEQDGLVNVFAADLIDVENVNVAAVAQVIAGVCPAVTANVAAIASEVDQSGTSQDIMCTTEGPPVTISQNNPGRGRPETPPGRVSQDGLVNVFAADLIDVRDVNATVAAQVIAAVCPAVTANVAALVSQVDQSGTAQDVECPTTGAPSAVHATSCERPLWSTSLAIAATFAPTAGQTFASTAATTATLTFSTSIKSAAKRLTSPSCSTDR
jgi:hypothetical protein